MVGFNGVLDIGKEEDQRQIGRWKRTVSRFKGILMKMIGEGKDSPKIRQILLHWGNELKNQKIVDLVGEIRFLKVHQIRQWCCFIFFNYYK